MIVKLFLLLFIAHLISDFILQPQSWSDLKSEATFTRYHVFHILVVAIFSLLLSLDPGFWLYALILTVLHLLTDILKSYFISKYPGRRGSLFFGDQMVHLVLIFIVAAAYDKWHGIRFIYNPPIDKVAMVAGFILCLKPANIVIKHLLSVFSISISDDATGIKEGESLPNAGKLIGISERLLALVLILYGQFEAVGLIIAAKSILRLSGTQKSEYVLTGTLLSFGIAVFSGIAIKLL
jgi:hypothetical protein